MCSNLRRDPGSTTFGTGIRKSHTDSGPPSIHQPNNHPQPKNFPQSSVRDVLVSPFRQDTSADFQGRPPCYPMLSSLCRGSPFAAVHCMATVPKSIICQAASDWLKIPILANQRRQGAPLIKSFECPGSNIPVALQLTDSAMDEWWNQAVLCSYGAPSLTFPAAEDIKVQFCNFTTCGLKHRTVRLTLAARTDASSHSAPSCSVQASLALRKPASEPQPTQC